MLLPVLQWPQHLTLHLELRATSMFIAVMWWPQKQLPPPPPHLKPRAAAGPAVAAATENLPALAIPVLALLVPPSLRCREPHSPDRAALAGTMDALDREADGKAAKGEALGGGGGSEEGKRLLETLEGRRVTVTGVFDHGKEVLVGEEGGKGRSRRWVWSPSIAEHDV